jgi:radical SAM superfamily enzyme YgiQ (UPF0313 family)
MHVKLILPALTEAHDPHFRPIKYSLFPPLGLATLAASLDESDTITLVDEHVQPLSLDDEPDLVAIEVYTPSALRAYQIADAYRHKGAYICLGGLHVTSLPDEAARHADTIFTGPGEDTWPTFLRDFRARCPAPRYASSVRTLEHLPMPRRDLFQRQRYLVPNSIVVSRGCPHACDFCYKDTFFQGGKSFYTLAADRALEEIQSLPGKHLYFLDDHLFGNPRFAGTLFQAMRGMGRVWQAAATVRSILPAHHVAQSASHATQPDLLEQAAACGLRSLFVGFETLNPASLAGQHKHHNLHLDYAAAIRRLHDLGVMVNASFVFGLDEDDPSVFERTVEWAVRQGIETATFHILTPFPGTGLYARMTAQGRLLHTNWDRYNTRYAVFRPARMTPEQLEAGYWQAYRQFYSWGSIFQAAATQDSLSGVLRHLAYTGGWKKAEPLWDWVIRMGWLPHFLPILESVLQGSPLHPRRAFAPVQPQPTENPFSL